MSTSNQLSQFWIEFLDLYKSLPQLWKVAHDGYSHKHTRTAAYEMLLEKYHEFDEGANMDHLKKKLSNMRTCFRRESKKVEEDNCYTPMLWYYPYLEFLKDQEDPSESMDGEKFTSLNVKREAEVKRLPLSKKRKHSHMHAHKRYVEEVSPPKSHHSSRLEPHPQHSSRPEPDPQPQPQPQPHMQHSSKPDEAKIVSATWEILYRNLKPLQKLYANRVITEVLYLGAFSKLNENSYKALDDQSNHGNNQLNPINITVDSLDYDNDTSVQLSNINDALSNLKQLENFAVRENHEAIDLIIQLEEMLKNSGDDEVNEVDEDDADEREYSI